MAAQDNNTNAQGKRKPGWMSIKGGPKEPVFADFKKELDKLNGKKSGLFDRLAEIRNELDAGRGGAGEDDSVRDERKRLQDRMREIRDERKKLNGMKEDKFSERQGLQSERRALQKQIEEFSDELSGFDSLDAIESAIDRVLIHMETGSGSLKSEKKTLKRITQLEKAKSMVLNLKLMEERAQESQQEELELGQEYSRIRQQIESLDKQFKQVAEQKTKVDDKKQKDNGQRDKLKEERTKIRASIDEVNKEVTELRAKFDEQKEAWNKWKDVAIKQYNEERDRIRAEKQKAWEEREARKKDERKKARAAKRLNPYANEIDACATLIRYLQDKTSAHQRDKERIEHEKKLAEFNAAATAPQGKVLGGFKDDDEDWAFADRTKKSQKQKAPKKKEAEKPAEKKGGSGGEKMMSHSMDRMRSFELVSVEKPLSYGQIPATIETLKAKKKEYESHIKSLDEVSTPSSTDVDEPEEEETAAAPAEETTEEKTEEAKAEAEDEEEH